MKTLFPLIIFLLLTLSLHSQTEYEAILKVGESKEIGLKLYSNVDGKYLLDLSVTFQLTGANNLIMMLGNGKPLQNDHNIWLFSPAILLKNFLEKNKNVVAGKEFKNSNAQLNKFYAGNGFEYMSKYNFDDGYETIKRNPKPVFFQVTDNNIELYLYFYVSSPNKKNPNLNELTAKVKPVKVTIKILKK